MSQLSPHATDAVLGLEDFLERVEREIDFDAPDGLLAATPLLSALANDRHFLVERLNAELASGDFQPGNEATAATLHLATRARFFVRANIWMPWAASGPARDWQQQLFFYDVPHDHDLDFLTVGYHGPGYETDLWEYERASIVGRPGEPVVLTPRGRFRLSRGTVMHYRAHVDVHTQWPPEALSVSINLVSRTRRHRWEQLLFDVEQGSVRAPVEGASRARATLCMAAAQLGDARTAALLERVAYERPCETTRLAALDGLANLEPSHGERL
ncbi:hypothetical protein [Hyalangium gracile]|uniref:hypothetical protein n=1 Tax=Hyalangium gracile TaxID=394092 RepID=UPI001CCD6B12|nr:hypothetical protein [Hyalangium gracile]